MVEVGHQVKRRMEEGDPHLDKVLAVVMEKKEENLVLVDLFEVKGSWAEELLLPLPLDKDVVKQQ